MNHASETVSVALGDRSYDILIGPDLLARAGELISPLLARPVSFIVTDQHVADLHLAAVSKALGDAGITVIVHTVAPGETSKSFAALEALTSAMLDARLERRDIVIALGGGVVGDLTGFAASVLRRGMDFIQVPTTLLAQVDSSVGGKTGINTTHGKNLVGAFHQPRLVLADTQVLDTLPRRELLAGYAEVVKYGLIGDAGFFSWLQEHGASLLDGNQADRVLAIAKSCRAKADIVAQDERESGIRALLNLGHTFGHALEAETGFGQRLLHGEGVAVGMVLAFETSARMGLCGDNAPTAIREHFRAVGLPASISDIDGEPLDPERLLAHMAQDKKVKDGRITFVLAQGIGDAILTDDVDLDLVRDVLANS
ncbi:MAG: 3-dehydroquinate synthase [Alphaproteobacteria bacterium]